MKPPRYLTHFSRVGSAVAAIPARFIACIAVLCLVMCSTAPLRAEILVTQLSSSTGGNGNILHYDDSGNFLGVLIPNLQVPESAEFGTDGKLYVPEFSGNRVLRFLADGTPDGVFCSPPGPAAIAFDAAGMAYVYLPSFGVIHRFDSDGTLQGVLVFPYGPGYTRMGPDGYLYTASWVGNNVSRMKTDGTEAVKLFDAARATDVTFAANGDLYVSLENDGIYRWNGTTLIPVATNFGFRVEGIKFDRFGNLIVGTAGPGYVVRLKPDGTWDTVGSGLSFPVWVTVTPTARPADTIPPVCQVGSVVVQSPTRVYVPITLTDAGSGVAQVKLTPNSTNCQLEWDGPGGLVTAPIGTPITINPAVASTTVRVVKLNTSQRSRVELQVRDAAGNTTVRDPVIANLTIKNGRAPLVRVFHGIPQAERYITLQNGTPGLTRATLTVNGRVVSRGSLTDRQVVSLDVAQWLRSGKNTVRLAATGPKGATAVLTIGDVAPSAGAAVSASGATVNQEFSP